MAGLHCNSSSHLMRLGNAIFHHLYTSPLPQTCMLTRSPLVLQPYLHSDFRRIHFPSPFGPIRHSQRRDDSGSLHELQEQKGSPDQTEQWTPIENTATSVLILSTAFDCGMWYGSRNTTSSSAATLSCAQGRAWSSPSDIVDWVDDRASSMRTSWPPSGGHTIFPKLLSSKEDATIEVLRAAWHDYRKLLGA